MTGVGVTALLLLFVGLVLSVVALVLLFRRSRRAPVIASVAFLLFLPAEVTELTSTFSSLRPPAAIQRLELVQLLVVVAGLITGAWLLRRSS